jgi:hypothetical protein
MTTPQNTMTSPVPITVTASTDNPHDTGYHHCFEQRDDATLTFNVEIDDSSVKTIHFVLWALKDPANPKMVESTDFSVVNGQVTIQVSHHHSEGHLGPGPYCAALTASTTAVGDSSSAGTIVGETVYYYETWEGTRNCKYPR